MPTFIALLRGINVGKVKRVPMAELRALLAGLGYGDVQTLLNSGNAVFTHANASPAAERALRRLGDDAQAAGAGGPERHLILRDHPNLHPYARISPLS